MIEETLNQSLSKKSKIIKSLQQLSGLVISDLSPEIRKKLEDELSGVNQIISRYDIATFDDYSKLNKRDLKRLIEILQTICHGFKEVGSLK